jgi:hypothetical protein
MSHYLTKTFALVFVIGTALTCGAAFAAAATEKTASLEKNTRSAVPAKPSRPFYTFLPDTAVGASYKPFLQYPGAQSPNLVYNKETADNAAFPTGTLFPAQETRPMRSLMIGWLPAKDDTTTAGRYQPGSYQYVSTATEAECRTVDKAGNAEEIPYGGNKGLRLPAAWLLGMCLHY